jgi:small subunit ribosomal protein S6
VGTYEIVAVLRPDLDEEALGAALTRVNQRITEHGGTVTSQERWGKRKLAYPIKKYRDGFYALTVFTLDAARIAPLRQVLGLNEELLRFALATHRAKPATPAAAHGQPAAAAPAAGTPTPAAPPPAGTTGAPAPAGGATGQPSGQTEPAPEAPHV